MTRLSVNINKIALIRNARGGNNPDLLQIAKDCERFGAQGITVHPRPDQRHIRISDVYTLKDVVTTEFNIEGYPTPKFIKQVCDVKPHQVTLVPDLPDALTSDSGWDCIKHKLFLKEVIAEFKANGIRTSIFLNPDLSQVEPAKLTGTDRIELYTEPFATNFPLNPKAAIKDYIETAKTASNLGLGVNAGHDLNLENLRFFNENIPALLEVSIGHALVCDALYYGLENTIRMYQQKLLNY